MPEPLTDQERARVAEIAAVLFPASAEMPGAADTGAAGKWLDRVLAADPLRIGALRTLAARSEDDPWAAAEGLFRDDPDSFEDASDTLVTAYYMHPGVRKRIGYPGQKGQGPIAVDEAEHYLTDELIAPMRARAPLYVPTPDV
jgi:hypothetical protein